jgi:hypothetical protein
LDKYKEYWLFSPKEINMVESNERTSIRISIIMSLRQNESDDEVLNTMNNVVVFKLIFKASTIID